MPISIGGSRKSTTQNIQNTSITQQLDNVDGAVITGAEGDQTINILDGGAIQGSLNVAQSAIESTVSAADGAFTFAGDITDTAFASITSALESVSESASNVASNSRAQVRDVAALVGEASRSDTADSLNRFLAIGGGVAALGLVVFLVRR